MNRQLLPTLRLSVEMTDVLAKIEHAGIKINLDTLQEIKKEYEQELDQTQRRLDEIVYSVMGDTPINLNSADDRTVLFITHRLNTIKNSDDIIVMHEGSLVEQGTHDELMKLGQRYSTLYRQQGE